MSKTVILSRQTNAGKYTQLREHGATRMASLASMGPMIPVIRCVKYKGHYAKLAWEINCNDPRYAALDATLNLLPNMQRQSPFTRNMRTILNQWELTIEEYRAIAGREGPLGYGEKYEASSAVTD